MDEELRSLERRLHEGDMSNAEFDVEVAKYGFGWSPDRRVYAFIGGGGIGFPTRAVPSPDGLHYVVEGGLIQHPEFVAASWRRLDRLAEREKKDEAARAVRAMRAMCLVGAVSVLAAATAVATALLVLSR